MRLPGIEKCMQRAEGTRRHFTLIFKEWSGRRSQQRKLKGVSRKIEGKPII